MTDLTKSDRDWFMDQIRQLLHAEFERMNAGLAPEERLNAIPVYGGVGYGPQVEAFEKGAQLVVGTPGRVLDHLSRGTLKLDKLRTIILDEADEMLSMGFFPDMIKVRRYLPKQRDSYMFSATMPFQVQRIGKEFLTDPVFLATADSAYVTGQTIYADGGRLALNYTVPVRED